MPVKVTKQTGGKNAGKKVKKSSVIDRIQPLDFDENESGISMVIYGKSGTGKTTLASTFPAPILWLVCSGGKNPGELRSVATAENKKRIFPVTINESDELLEILEHQAETNKYRTVVLDHVTGMQDRLLAEITGVERMRAQRAWGDATRQQYGQLAMQAKEISRLMLDLPCNRLFLGQERVFETETETEDDLIVPYVAAAGTPSYIGWLNYACDYVVQTYQRPQLIKKQVKQGSKTVEITKRTNRVDFCLRVYPDSVNTIKFRMPKNRDRDCVMTDPSYDKLIKLIRGGS